ncbi:hypothetical protein A7A76_07615 [Lysobacter enzymogenes]|uniref:YqaJ viral recombinase family protein n=1 Tax=Lysobacter enzymogenes TaxID=69 RepID=UPI0019D0138A|nr:YqaJ viral recombinase family protein [Lysobacter enzymogenes]MBN7138960.1 hypothetical protein [Lysobacter enzymogenes]
MKTLQLIQGTPEWHAHRAEHYNASDAPAMLGCSPYTSRSQLIRRVATGIGAEIDAATQARFDVGHHAEAKARPLAEVIVGEELYPCVGVAEAGPYSASFDGLTVMEDVAFEHKALNETLRAAMFEGCTGADLPKPYRVQMEQQLLVSGAARVLFMASKWEGDTFVEERHCWYTPDPALRAEIVAGWDQFAADVAAYVAEPAAAPAAVARAPEGLPALSVVARGLVEHSNHVEFREKALAAIAAVNRDLQSDDDFASAELTIKTFKDGEELLEATRAQILGQMADVNAVMQTIDDVSAALRRVRLDLDKLVKAEKESRKAEIVQAGARSVRAHYDTINATMGEHRIQPPQSLMLDLGAAIKGKRTLSSMKDAVDTAAAAAKIAGSQQAERVRACVRVLEMEVGNYGSLFPDRIQLCTSKQPEDLRNLIAARIGEQQQRDAERLEKERERIRAEESDEAAQQLIAQAAADSSHGNATAGGVPDSGEVPDRVRHMTGSGSHAQGAGTPATDDLVTAAAALYLPRADEKIKLGDINCWIAPLTVNEAGLAELGFKPVATLRSAKLYRSADLPAICDALIRVVAAAPARATGQEAA